MNFIEMIKLLKRGKKVTNSEHIKLYKQYITWQDDGEIVCMEEGDEKWRGEWIFDFQDYISESWELYEEKPTLHTFEEALKALKSGKYVRRPGINWTSFCLEDASGIKYLLDRLTNRAYSTLRFSVVDVMSNDWEISE